MKFKLSSVLRMSRVAAITALGLLAFPMPSDAKPKYRSNSYHGRYERGWNHYHSYPRSGFSITFGTGYAGRGYYYGPPGVPYFYERPGVRYYRNRWDVPRSYYDGGRYYGGGTAVEVQRALYRMGYYRGPIDGDIGPGSRRAIARYQASRGLPVTGVIDRSLLYSLGLR